MNTSSSINGAVLFQTIVNNTCHKLEQKNAGFILIRLNQLDSLLSGIEKRLLITSSTLRVERPA
ncbi:MAG: hypothetical protein LBD44_01280 [Spirochaetaceae bacterium]|jgi:hypothetical protein|nr:hypothetical protein [Spirochaetaceae bacterium]